MNNGDSMPLQSDRVTFINLIFIIFVLIFGTFIGMQLFIILLATAKDIAVK